MSEYINKETVLQDMGERYDCYNPEIEADRNIRKGFANVQEVKHGKWERYGCKWEYRCSECHYYLLLNSPYDDLHIFCPNCGAKMDKEE